MEQFLPSNIAKAVYGYLISEGCDAAANTFLETSPRLTECREWVQQGKAISNANTQLLGRNLVEVLNLALSAYSLVDHIKGNEHRLLSQGEKGASKLYDEVRRFVTDDIALAGRVAAADNNQEQPASQDFQAPANDVPPTLTLHTPPYSQPVTPPAKDRRSLLAEDYKCLVQQSVGESFDSSLSSDKFQRFKTLVSSPPRLRTNSAPGSLLSPDLKAVNQSAIDAISVIPFGTPLRTQLQDSGLMAVTSASAPNPQTVTSSNAQTTNATSSNVVTSSIDVPEAPGVTRCYSVPLPVLNCLPSSYAQPIISGAACLPDPPIILLKNEPYDTGEQAASFFETHPNAVSTPFHSQFNPEDTACIIYPPVVSDLSPSKSNSRRSRRSRKHVLRRILPKPHKKDPPNILHIKVLPPQIEVEEEDEDMADDPLAKNSDESSDHIEKSATQKQTAEDTKEIDRYGNPTEPTDTEVTTSNNQKEISLPDNLNTKTPKAPRPEFKKNISRSTPRRNSHVRALSFNTPLKPIAGRKANTSPKMPRIRFSPRRSKINSVKRSSLFSPTSSKKPLDLGPLVEVKESQGDSGRAQKCKKNFNSLLSKVPIATRSPAPKLSSAWKEVNDVVITNKPVWDKAIRSFITGDFVDPPPPPKRETKPKHNETDSEKSDDESSSNEKCNKKETAPRRSSRLNGTKEKTAQVPSKKVLKKRKKLNKLTDKSNKSRAGSSKSPAKKNKVLNKSCVTKKPLDKMKICTSQIVDSCSDDVNTIKLSDGKNSSKDVLNSSSEEQISENKMKFPDGKNKINTSVNSDISDENCLSHMNGTVTEKTDLSEEQHSQPTNVLVEDLVVSSNSLPPVGASPEKDNGNIAKDTVISKERTFEKISSDSPKAVTLPGIPGKDASETHTFSIPGLPLLETPMKDIQNLPVPQTPVLNTPLLKTIRNETSILHEDLLLTPSLPPTPQVQSGQLSEKTPVKLVVATEKTDNPTLKNIPNCDENDKIGECSTNTKKSNNTSNVSNIGSLINKPKVCKMREMLVSSDSTSDDSSEEGSGESLDEPPWVDPKDIPKIRTRIIQEGSVKSKCSKNAFKTTSNKTKQVSEISDSKPVTQKQDNISKLINTILEDQMKSLNNKSIKQKDKKKVVHKKTISKKHSCDTGHSEENIPTSSSYKSKNNKCLKKNTRTEHSKVSSGTVQKNKCPTVNVGKNNRTAQSPEKIQLTLDLLKQERKIIFGEGYSTSSSDTDFSDVEVFDRKNRRVKQKQSKATLFKSKDKKAKLFIPKDSSSTEDEIQTEKSVSFETTAQVHVSREVNSSGSCVVPLIIKDPKTVDENMCSKELLKEKQKDLFNKTSFDIPKDSSSSEDEIKTNKTGKSVSFEASAQVHVIPEFNSSESCVAPLIEKDVKTVDEQCSKELPKGKQPELLNAVEAITSTDTGQSSEITGETTENQNNKNTPSLFDDDNASCNFKPIDLQPTQIKHCKSGTCDVAKKIKLPDVSDTLSISCDSTLLDSHEEMKSKNMSISHQDISYEEEENHIVIVSTTQKHSTNALCPPEFDPTHTVRFDAEGTITTLSFSEIFVHLSPNLKRKKIKLTPVQPEVFEQFKGDFDSRARSHYKGVWKRVVDVAPEKENNLVNSSKNSKDNTLKFTSQHVQSPSCLDSAEKDLLKSTSTPPRSIFDSSDKCETDLSSKPQFTSISVSSATSKKDFLSKTRSSTSSTPGSSDKFKENTLNTSYKTPNSSVCHSDISGECLLPKHRYHEHVKYESRKFADDRGNHDRDYKTPNTSYKTPNRSISHSDRSGEDFIKTNCRSDENVRTGGRQYEDKRDGHCSDKRDNHDNRRQGREHADRLTIYQLDRRKERDLHPRRRESPRRKSNELYYHRERPGRWQHKHDYRDNPERRHNSSRYHHFYRRDDSRCDHKRQDFEKYSDRFARPGVTRSFSDRPKATWKDLDMEPKERTDDSGHSSKLAETLDRRFSTEILRYSTERSPSLSDEAGSLMDYAVTSTSRKSRSSAQSFSNADQSVLVNVSKRKKCEDGSSMEQTQEEKRLRLANEVEIREAKSVLKHKMADMLNALHPIQQRKIATVDDVSNEVPS